MSKSSDALVGALGMKARKLGASIETTAVARCVAEEVEDLVVGAPLGADQAVASSSSGTGARPPKSSGIGDSDSRSRQ